jgi:hypothetical protein
LLLLLLVVGLLGLSLLLLLLPASQRGNAHWRATKDHVCRHPFAIILLTLNMSENSDAALAATTACWAQGTAVHKHTYCR